ncbi:MAG: intradiol ring-cleavage dioxygenase [Acetobacteraceae bacterium]|nr:intradiol ring-cleavage dioxygenase [Acetobacteraceae bacterium]
MRHPSPTPPLPGRRGLALGSVAGLSSLAAAASLRIAPGAQGQSLAAALVPTPRQTAGPFYPLDWSGDVDADLVQVAGEAAHAQGVIMHLRGRVLDARGAPVPGAVLEIWQCDAFGHYRHPRDRQGQRDGGFQGRGRAVAGPDGSYAFRTIRPVPYPGRTPHIHLAAAAAPSGRGGAVPLVTQLYLAGEPLNERDGLFLRLRDPRDREAVLLRPQPADRIEPGALLALRDIVLG